VTARAVALALVVACSSGSPGARPVFNVAPPAAPPIALAIVFAGQELAVGNEDYETDPHIRMRGVLHGLESGLDELGLTPGSEAIAIAYSNGATIAMPWTPAARVHGALLGDQADYKGKIGSDVVAGITLALDELARRTERRKLLVVIGDGNDTYSGATPQLIELRVRAHQLGVHTRALVLKMPISPSTVMIDRFTDDARRLGSESALIGALVAAITAR
jgi:hypothetical protein